ncbi:MAG: flagellar biosynthesis protein FlhB [Leptospirillia bacterium]
MSQTETGQEKTEAATPKRREDARKKGQVGKSRELPMAAGLLAAGGFFWVGGPTMLGKLADLMKIHFSGLIRADLSIQSFHSLFTSTAETALLIMLPLLAVMVVSGVLSNIVQTGPLISLTPLAPKFSKISPMQGIKRMFSATTLMELLKSIFKLLVIAGTVYYVVNGEMARVPSLTGMEVARLVPYIGGLALEMALATGLVLLMLALIDLGFQRFDHEKKIRMTKDEIRREMKEMEGDPMVRARIRSVQREAARKRMMAEVPEADVVVTNPTHLAVALKYESASMAAPRVVAKGAGFVARKIKELAAEHGVPVMEDKPLARALYKGVEVGQEVPYNLYQAVAEVLAFVYRLNRAGKVTA